MSTDVLEHERDDSARSLKVDRRVPADLPEFAKKILGDKNRVIQTEKWTATGGGYVCDLDIDFPGKPLHVKGTLEIKPTGADTSDWVVDMDVKASVPLVGGKLEGVVQKETIASLDKEYAFNQEWLAEH
ncbi:MAG: DUF2505 domain-containing protein [Candidatus Nanopelagicales bacterium]